MKIEDFEEKLSELLALAYGLGFEEGLINPKEIIGILQAAIDYVREWPSNAN